MSKTFSVLPCFYSACGCSYVLMLGDDPIKGLILSHLKLASFNFFPLSWLAPYHADLENSDFLSCQKNFRISDSPSAGLSQQQGSPDCISSLLLLLFSWKAVHWRDSSEQESLAYCLLCVSALNVNSFSPLTLIARCELSVCH